QRRRERRVPHRHRLCSGRSRVRDGTGDADPDVEQHGRERVEDVHRAAAGLSFLGLGVTPPAAEWGLMLNTLRQSIYVNAVVPALPGLAIFVTSMAFNLLSDGLRDAMEIRA